MASSLFDKRSCRGCETWITDAKELVIVGTGAFIITAKNVPLGMMMTGELDVYARGTRSEEMSDLIDGSLGEGSHFDKTHGYYAHGGRERTACMPSDWERRAKRIEIPSHPEIICPCPDHNDISISKVCAWREKDQEWLNAGLSSGMLRVDLMRERIEKINNPNAPDLNLIEDRLNRLSAPSRDKSRVQTRAGSTTRKGASDDTGR